MNKQQALKHLHKHSTVGCNEILLSIFNDTEQIPQDLIDLCCAKREPRDFLILGGEETIKKWNQLLNSSI